VAYWQKASQRAVERSAHVEAISHVRKGLEVLQTLQDAPARVQQELVLQTTLGQAFMATKGLASPDVEHTYTRARELCQQIEEMPQLFPILSGLQRFYVVRAELQTARELGQQLLSLAQHRQDLALLLEAHRALGNALAWLGEVVAAHLHLEQGITLYDPQQHRSHANGASLSRPSTF
jgi:tetratricopeptide (TPR) repeat protein